MTLLHDRLDRAYQSFQMAIDDLQAVAGELHGEPLCELWRELMRFEGQVLELTTKVAARVNQEDMEAIRC